MEGSYSVLQLPVYSCHPRAQSGNVSAIVRLNAQLENIARGETLALVSTTLSYITSTPHLNKLHSRPPGNGLEQHFIRIPSIASCLHVISSRPIVERICQCHAWRGELARMALGSGLITKYHSHELPKPSSVWWLLVSVRNMKPVIWKWLLWRGAGTSTAGISCLAHDGCVFRFRLWRITMHHRRDTLYGNRLMWRPYSSFCYCCQENKTIVQYSPT